MRFALGFAAVILPDPAPFDPNHKKAEFPNYRKPRCPPQQNFKVIVMDTTLFTSDFKSEQISKEAEYSLIAQAQERYKLLTTAQDLNLEAKKTIRQGERALERLLASLGKYIESRIWRLLAKNPTLNRDDLRQSAQEGIIKAIHNFDLTKGFRLITWAWYQISSKFKKQITGEVTQSKAENNAKTQTPVAQDNPQIDVLQLDSVKQVVAKFKQPIKKIIELRTEGYEFPEIGKLLDKTSDACRIAYNRAIQRIRQLLLPSKTVYPATPSTQWMSRLKLRLGKNVRFGYGPRHNNNRVQDRNVLGFAISGVGQFSDCQTQIQSIGLLDKGKSANFKLILVS